MKVISVNISSGKTIDWKGKKVNTGIYKKEVEAITLGEEGVKDDKVVDTKYHGGKDKACYMYSTDHYSYWKEKYPDLNWEYGMFGENISVEGLNEKNIKIGDVFQVGEATVQVTQPRQPCFKLGIRFGSQKMVKEFLNSPFPGVYCRILKEGKVQKGDSMSLVNSNCGSISVADTFSLFSSKKGNRMLLKMAVKEKYLAESCRNDLTKQLRND